MQRLTFLAALALCPAMAAAEQHWVKATSTNFEVYTTAGEKKAREVVLYFEQVNGFFQTAFHTSRSAKGRVRIVAFQSAKEYKPYQLYEAVAFAGGGPDRDEIVMGGTSAEFYPVAIHEYVHILVKPVKNVPIWLNEGLAELYSSLRPMGKKVLVGEVLPGRLAALEQGKWINLETLCSVDRNSPYYTTDHSKVTVFYAESWLLTHMLFLGDGYRPKFPEFERMLLGGTAPADAFQKAFGKSMAEVLADLHQYGGIQIRNGLLFSVPLAKSAEDPEVEAVTPFEAGLLLAGVLADTRKMDEATQAYAKLAAENPSSPAVPEALGYLAWRRDQLGEARSQFAKAAELGSKDARMYYDYCGLAGRAGDPRSLQVSLLRKALDLDPEYPDARFHLGLLLMSESDYAGALAEFARLKKVEPEHAFELFSSIAYAAYRTGDKERAVASAKRAAEYAHEPFEKSSIESLQAAIEDRTAAPPSIAEPTGQSGQPALEHHAATPPPLPPKRPPLKLVEGTLDQIDCLGTAARMHMTAAGHAVLLLIDKPNSIEVRGSQTGSFDLTCGPQKPPRAMLVGFEPKQDSARGTIGLVRLIEMK